MYMVIEPVHNSPLEIDQICFGIYQVVKKFSPCSIATAIGLYASFVGIINGQKCYSKLVLVFNLCRVNQLRSSSRNFLAAKQQREDFLQAI